MYHQGDHIRIEAGNKIEASLASMVVYRNPEIENEWRESGTGQLLSTYVHTHHFDLVKNEIDLRKGSKIRVVAFFSDKNEKSA